MQKFLPTICIQWKSVQRCVRKLPKFKGIYRGCHWQSVADWWPNSPALKAFSNTSCAEYFVTNKCNKQCTKDAIELLKHSCMQGDLGEWLDVRAGVPRHVLHKCATVASSANNTGSYSNLSIFNIIVYFCMILRTSSSTF